MRLVMLVLPLMAACSVTGPSPDDLARLDARCEAPRPDVCTQEYRPVCGLVDTGVPCVTMPCPAEEWLTYSNACTACSDPRVIGYRSGECDEVNTRDQGGRPGGLSGDSH
jgi:hypothetical protein